MKGLISIIVLLLFGRAAVANKPECGLLDNFWANLQILFVEPVADRFTFVMYNDAAPPPQMPASSLPIYNRNQPFDQRCAALGVHTALDILVVNAKALTGLDLIPSILQTPKLTETIWALNVCNKMSSISSLPDSYSAPEVCKAATDLVRCSTFNSVWLLPWLVLLGAITLAILIGAGCLAFALR